MNRALVRHCLRQESVFDELRGLGKGWQEVYCYEDSCYPTALTRLSPQSGFSRDRIYTFPCVYLVTYPGSSKLQQSVDLPFLWSIMSRFESLLPHVQACLTFGEMRLLILH
jgi:hypothetical protein